MMLVFSSAHGGELPQEIFSNAGSMPCCHVVFIAFRAVLPFVLSCFAAMQVSAGGLVSALMGVSNFKTCWVGWPGVRGHCLLTPPGDCVPAPCVAKSC